MHRYQRWNFKDAAPILPLDPYKPAKETFDVDPGTTPPPDRRVGNAFFSARHSCFDRFSHRSDYNPSRPLISLVRCQEH